MIHDSGLIVSNNFRFDQRIGARKAVTLALERQDEGEKRFATVIKEKVRPEARGADIERLDERKT